MVRVGTAGWSYQDWEGRVYPAGRSGSREALDVLAGLFDMLEINVTFYRPPSPRMSESWARRVESRPGFRFTAKIWQEFTHRRGEPDGGQARSFDEGIGPLRQSGRLGALLAQFPQSFRLTDPNRSYLERLLDRFAGQAVVVELRHASWMTDEILAMLEARGAGLCNVDQPRLGEALPPTSVMVGGVGYVRLHGRNSQAWFSKQAGRDARYDYLYGPEEIAEWVARVRLMQGRAERSGGGDIFIVANNHYRGQAVVNALEIRHALSGRKVEAPEDLVRAYPRLGAIAKGVRPAPGGQPRLPL